MHFEFENPVDSGDLATVNCAIAKADPPFEITWKKDGRKLDSNDGIIILRSGQRLSLLNIVCSSTSRWKLFVPSQVTGWNY